MAAGFRARLRYRTDALLSGGAGKQLLLLFVLSMTVVLVHLLLAIILGLHVGDSFGDRFWFFFTRILDTGAMGGDNGGLLRIISAVDTVLGLVVAGLLISSLSGNFQARLEAIRRGGSAVVEENHFLVLGWSEKIYSVIDQLSEANVEKGRITVVVMAEREKTDMEERLRAKVVHQKRCKLVVRAGSSVSIQDLGRVAFDSAQAIVVLVDENDTADANRADGRIIKTLLAIYNHPDLTAERKKQIKVTAEVMLPENQEVAQIASNRLAQVVKTNEIISKIILQTSRISGLSVVYDELLRFEGNEIHYAKFPQIVGRLFGDILLDFPNGCVCGVAKADGSSHILNPPADHVIATDEELLILAEDDHIEYRPYDGTLKASELGQPAPQSGKPVEHMLILGWNEKIFPIIQEFDNYVGAGSTLTLVNSLDKKAHEAALAEHCTPMKNIDLRHVAGQFTNRALLEKLQPQKYPTVMVLGDTTQADSTPEAADTRAIIALLLLRDFRARTGLVDQKVCSEILEPKNRELAATTEIHDIVISNEMVSMVLAQITHEPRVRPVLEDLFRSEGSEVYLKDLALYAPPGSIVTFDHLILAAKARGEVALGLQVLTADASKRYGIALNPLQRRAPFTPKPGDRLIVLAEDDG